jgi:predicted pyridoxine 5'-phosphate oxidase superfamily flavin-nucleotide-binding protein
MANLALTMQRPASDVAFSPAVKIIQTQRGSRAAYARAEKSRGFESTINDDLRGFLAGIDTAFLATASADGQPYVQHRGGPPGFIRALDDQTLAFVDFAGNRQFVSTGNLSENDRVCLFLIDYAHRRRVKVWGTAKVVPATPDLLGQLAQPGYRGRPEQIMLITVTAWDVNCPQHIPQKVDAALAAAALTKAVGEAVAPLRARIDQLEAENARLRGHRS